MTQKGLAQDFLSHARNLLGITAVTNILKIIFLTYADTDFEGWGKSIANPCWTESAPFRRSP
jgi:hypothetical protein